MINDLLKHLLFLCSSKLTFVSSRIQSATVSKCKDLFGIGSTRMCRIINSGIEYGLLKRDNKDLVATSLKREKSYHIRLDFECKTYSRTKALMSDRPKIRAKPDCMSILIERYYRHYQEVCIA